MLDDLLPTETDSDPSICVVRLTRSVWATQSGLHCTTRLVYLKRQCHGYNLLKDGASDVGASETWDSITNLDSCDDGLYQVIVCNEHRDWESGHIDDYDLKLVPFVK